MAYVAIADQQEEELHDPQSFVAKYVWSQDHKVIAIQYSLIAISVGLVALVLSGMMRLQLAWPNEFDFIDPQFYYQSVTMHGMIMVIYLLTALFLGGFGNYLIPLMCGARDMVFPFMNMLSVWVYFLAVIILMASFFIPGGPTGAGWTLYPPQSILEGTPGANGGIVFPRYGTKSDEAAQATIRRAFPGREIAPVDIEDIVIAGGGIHCITQQQPK